MSYCTWYIYQSGETTTIGDKTQVTSKVGCICRGPEWWLYVGESQKSRQSQELGHASYPIEDVLKHGRKQGRAPIVSSAPFHSSMKVETTSFSLILFLDLYIGLCRRCPLHKVSRRFDAPYVVQKRALSSRFLSRRMIKFKCIVSPFRCQKTSSNPKNLSQPDLHIICRSVMNNGRFRSVSKMKVILQYFWKEGSRVQKSYIFGRKTGSSV